GGRARRGPPPPAPAPLRARGRLRRGCRLRGQRPIALAQAPLDDDQLTFDVDPPVLEVEELGLELLGGDAQGRGASLADAPQEPCREEAEAERDREHDHPSGPRPDCFLYLLFR